MRVFVTGATGFLGFAVVKELIAAGHEVTGLARSESSAQKLKGAGAKALTGNIEDLEILRKGTLAADGAVHTAFYHQISHIPLGTRLGVMLGGAPSGIVDRFMKASITADRRAIETMGEALKGKEGALVAAFASLAMEPGKLAIESDQPSTTSAGAYRGSTEAAMRQLAPKVRTGIVRLPPIVHGLDDNNGLLRQLIKIARKKKQSGYVGVGRNQWAAVHKLDAARLFRQVLEKGSAGGAYHAVAESGLPFKNIAEALGSELGLPPVSKATTDVEKHFGLMSPFVGVDNPVSSEWTQQQMNWTPTEAGALADLHGSYFRN